MSDSHAHKSQLPISVIIITDKADDRLTAAVLSVENCAEILCVVASNSPQLLTSIKTLKLGVRIKTLLPNLLSGEQISDFSAAREWARSHATQNWVLMLDSDETAEWGSQADIKSFLEQKNIVGAVQRIDVFHGKNMLFGETAQSQPIRLFRREDVGRFSGAVHEVFTTDAVMQPAPLKIHHHSHRSITEFFSAIARFSALASTSEPQALWLLLIKLCSFPIGKFLYTFFWLQGFRDGWRGFTYSIMMSLHSLFVRIFAIENVLLNKGRS